MKRSTLVWSLALTTVALTACGDDSTAPSGGLSASDFMEAAGEAIASIGGALEDNEATATLSVLGFHITSVTSQATLSSPAGFARVPSGALGGTFLFDPELYQYVLDESASGAPADGARFLLYEVNEIAYEIVTPLNEIGHIDIRDLSGSTLDVRHVVVINGSTVLTFNVTGTVSETGADLTTSGTVNNGATSAEFSFDIEVSAAAQHLAIDATSGSYRLQWDYVRAGYGIGPGTDAITLSDSQSGGKIEMNIAWDQAFMGTGTVEFNDVVVADVAGSGGYPEVTPRANSGLDEWDALLLVEGYYEIFYLESFLLEMTVFGVENTGLQFPYAY